MSNAYVSSKDKDKKEKVKKEATEKVDAKEEATKKVKTEEKATEKVKTEEETTEKVKIEEEDEATENVDAEEETIETEEQTVEEEEYTDFNKAIEDTKGVAEKMFNDVVSTLKSRQEEWNKTLEEYQANKPPVDLLEYDDVLVAKIDAPRASKEDFSIMMSTDSIEIEIDFPETLTEDDEDDGVKVLRRERVSGKTKTIIPLPVEIDIKEVNAKFTDNELTLTLPKIKGKKVDVEIV